MNYEQLQKEHILTVRIYEKEYKTLKRIANIRGKDVSKIVRELLEDYIKIHDMKVFKV